MVFFSKIAKFSKISIVRVRLVRNTFLTENLKSYIEAQFNIQDKYTKV